jgi:RNA polymerase sigma-70 factor (ECF subfamily)
LLLVVAEGLQFDEAAQVMGVAVGTAKSRVIRARARLQEMLSPEPWESFGPSLAAQAAIQAF